MASSDRTIPFVVTSAAPTLEAVCASLAIGANTTFTQGLQSAFTEADIAWQTAMYHDDIHGLIHMMGKPANAPTAWKHQYFDVATNTWIVVSSGQWNNDGHIYGNFTMDFATGDLFQQRSSAGSDFPRRLRVWRWANRALGAGAWGVWPPNVNVYSGAMEAHGNGVCYHPNLYGPGKGATIWNEQNWLYVIPDETPDSPVRITYSPSYGDKEGANCYWPAANAAFVGGSIGRPLLRLTPNPTAGGAPILTNMGVPPIRTAGNSHLTGAGFGSLHVHPRDPNKLVILETAGPRVFESTNGSSWTQVGDHPFTRAPRIICSLRGNYGCFWSVGRDGTGNFSQLWKPT